ncbi:hypothetical protein [Shimia sp.]|uniref:hypothetical protein n=1 Tax=Shimia sp. TaxID=1954381 RepID=UPI00356B5306
MTRQGASRPYTWVWFNPTRLFRFLADGLAPLRWMVWLIWPCALFAGLAAAFSWYEMLAHVERVMFQLSFWQSMVASMLSSNLASKLALGIVLGHFRGDPQEFGVTLRFGLIPRFYVDRSPIRKLPLAQRRSCYAATLLAKVVLFAVGMLGWAIVRRSGSGAAEVLLALGITGFGSFVFVANPLLPLDGSNWLCARLGRPTLHRDSFRLTYMLATRRPAPDGLTPRLKRVMVLYALASIVFTAVLLYSVLSVVAGTLEAQFQGAGVLIFCFVLAAAIHFLVSRRNWRQPARTG